MANGAVARTVAARWPQGVRSALRGAFFCPTCHVADTRCPWKTGIGEQAASGRWQADGVGGSGRESPITTNGCITVALASLRFAGSRETVTSQETVATKVRGDRGREPGMERRVNIL